jgi:hypothetical protein
LRKALEALAMKAMECSAEQYRRGMRQPAIEADAISADGDGHLSRSGLELEAAGT